MCRRFVSFGSKNKKLLEKQIHCSINVQIPEQSTVKYNIVFVLLYFPPLEFNHYFCYRVFFFGPADHGSANTGVQITGRVWTHVNPSHRFRCVTANVKTRPSYLPRLLSLLGRMIDGSPDGFSQQINVQFVAPGSSLPKQFNLDELGRSHASRPMTLCANHTKTWSTSQKHKGLRIILILGRRLVALSSCRRADPLEEII